jgi:hypothetical protein
MATPKRSFKLVEGFREFFKTLSPHSTTNEEETQEVASSSFSLPVLPFELWCEILEWVIRPEFVVDLTFEPPEIDRAYRSLMNPYQRNSQFARKIARQNRNNLRMVCRTWKDFVDRLKEREWVLELYDSNGPLPGPHSSFWKSQKTSLKPNSPPIDTHQCSRLDLVYLDNTNTEFSVRYSHPVSTLSISISSSMFYLGDSGHISSLKKLVAFPGYLNALCIRVCELDISGDIAHEFQSSLSGLTLLCLCVKNESILQTPLEIPALVTLFLEVPQYESEIYSSWVLPSLRNLSLSTKYDSPHENPPENNPFFLKLLEEHFNTIQSLRMFPMIPRVSDRYSPLCWVCMPRLQVLATDFDLSMNPFPQITHRDNTESDISRNQGTFNLSSSVRHLIQITGAGDPRPQVAGIPGYIHACQRLETVSVATSHSQCIRLMYGPSPSGCIAGTLRRLAQQLRSLKDLCDTRCIQLMDREGSLIRKEKSRGILPDFLKW